ncbi:PREDICTED: 7-deoxyloganetic acid glucosyltransferase-like [Nicotiana attenuata]|uniref:Glycosyltransferase n=1 Tax=Nicotiana attenuata TaxID=49451 RepID=A0A1J6I813_NICAT|nr:PREDICTED: 7-deoxyloganetic acid glucosyltransferase-like [Nicotiana attenuata]AQQ16678.1 UDP-glycosyltransferase g24514 [Nicotiana attenuata]OIT00580.1 udp-glycosyltransferase 85a2 [Nicotiana attenuata]
MLSMDPSAFVPHVAIFPFPAQGHVNSMLKVAQLLSLSNFHVSFLVTVDTHDRLLNHTDVLSRFGSEFHLQALPGGISLDEMNTRDGVGKLYDSVNTIAKPFLREFLAESPVTCVIADGILSMVADVAEEINLPIIYFRTISACAFWSYFSIPELLQAGELPLKGNGMDITLTKVKGMEDFLRGRDLPSFCRVSDLTSADFRLLSTETRQTPRARGLILNTFEDLEGPILSQIRTVCPNVYTIGPVHAHLKARLATKCTSSNSLWQEDESCINWLDTQPPKSVLYVSFGSIAGVTKEELLEFWYGLVNSDQNFLWVMRADLIIGQEGKHEIPVELEQGTKARGYMADWVPQEKVLAHRAIGGFLTHSGWNSTLESIVEGVPMICWPRFADQQVNSRFIGEVWKMGLDIKDTCDRDIIGKSIRNLMEKRRGEFLQRTEQMASMARRTVNEGGSSYINLDRLIQDIRLMCLPLKQT